MVTPTKFMSAFVRLADLSWTSSEVRVVPEFGHQNYERKADTNSEGQCYYDPRLAIAARAHASSCSWWDGVPTDAASSLDLATSENRQSPADMKYRHALRNCAGDRRMIDTASDLATREPSTC